MVIEAGDGSWQKRLDAGQCPKCRHKLESYTVLSGVRQGTQLLKCPLCKLEIIQKDPKEITMLETKLMPSEEDICSVPERMKWSDAVHVLESLVGSWLDEHENDPKQWFGMDKNEAEAEVREAWKRILQG